MKKLVLLSTFSFALFALNACGSIPACNDDLSECERSGAYTEERTIGIREHVVVVEPAPAPVPEPIVEPVVVEPEPAPVQDIEVMRSAEPQFKQISK